MDAAVVNKTGQPLPARQRVADGFGNSSLLADKGELLDQPRYMTVGVGGFCFAAQFAALRGYAPDIVLDLVEFGGASERVAGNLALARWLRALKAPAHMAPQNAEDTR